MRKKTAVVGLATVCLVAGSGMAIASDSEHRARIAGAVYTGDAPTVIAESQDIFRQQGIRAEITYLDSGKQSLERLRNGKADFALSALTPVVLDRLADETPGGADDPVIIASLVHSSDLMQIVTSAESAIRVPADFAGKRIAINRGTNTEFVWWLYEQYHGLDRATVELVDMAFAEMLEALDAGRVDAALLGEPGVSGFEARLREAGYERARHIGLEDLYAGKWVIVTARSTARDQHDLCRRLLRAYDEAIDFIERSPEQAAALYDRQFDIAYGASSLDSPPLNVLAYDLGLDWSLIAGLQEQLHWARVAGYENRSGETVHVLDLLAPEPLHGEWPSRVGIPFDPPDGSSP